MKMPLLYITLLLSLCLVALPIRAQVSVDPNQCPDKCENSTLYLKGTFDTKLKICKYQYTEPCKYGCGIKSITKEVICNDFPEIPPANQTEYDTTIWKMVKKLYDKDKIRVSLSMHGTDYFPNDNGKIFLQLLDDSRQVINDSTCFVTAYYPNSTKFFTDQYMIYADDGLYYHDFIVPNIIGVYMASAKCYMPQLDINATFAFDNIECGNVNCGQGWSTNWLEYPTGTISIKTTGYTGTYRLTMTGTSSATPQINRSMIMTSGNTTTNSIVVNFYARKQNIAGDDYIYFWFCDGSNCYNLQTWSAVSPAGWELFSYTLDSGTYNLTNGATIKLKFNATGLDGSGDGLDLDDFNITRIYDFNRTDYFEIKGAGEINVLSFNSSDLVESIWTYYNRTLTSFDFIVLINDTNILNTLYDINASISSEFQETNSLINGLENLTASEVWSYFNRTLTDFQFTANINDSSILLAIQDANQSILDSIELANTTIIDRMDAHNSTIMNKLYLLQDDIANLNNISVDAIWSYYNRTLSDFDFVVTIDDSDILDFLDDMNISLSNQLYDIHSLILNITIGNVSVSANVDWNEGELVLYNITSPVQQYAQMVSYQSAQTELSVITDICRENNTLEHIVNSTRCFLEQCYQSSYSTYEACAYGCKSNMCLPAPYMSILIAIIIASIVIGVLWFVTRGR